MPLIPIVLLAGGAGFAGGYALSDATKYLSWLIVLGLVFFAALKMGVI